MHLGKKLVSVMLSAAMVVSTMLASTVKNVVSSNFNTTVKAATTSTFDNLDQEQIVASMGAGWNLGNQLEASVNGTPSETAWGNPTITENMIKAVKKAGFSTVRIPVSYLNYIGGAPNYTVNSAWLDRIQQIVDMCINNGLYAVINMHGDGYTSVNGSWLLCANSDQTAINAKYEAVWKQIASRFKNYDEHLIFESMNEEFNGTWAVPDRTAYSHINTYNQIFVDTVRQTGGNNAQRWLLIPGWNTDIEYTVGDYGFHLPTDNYCSVSGKKRIMISVHYYSPWEFCGQEDGSITQWGSGADSSKTASWGDESFMKTMFNKMYSKFVKAGYPVVIGEYGSIDKSSCDSKNPSFRCQYAKKVCSYAKTYGMVPVIWDNGYNGTYGFGIFDRNSCTVTQHGIIDAIMSVYPASSQTTTSPSPSPSTVVSPTPSTGIQTKLPSGIKCEYSVVSDWGSSFQGQIVLTNNSTKTYSGWTLSFDYNSTINSLWGAELASQTGTKVVVTNACWDTSLTPGASVTISFTAAGTGKNAPTNYSFK